MHSPEKPYDIGGPLLQLARRSVEHGLTRDEPVPIDEETLAGPLGEPGATFTTLRLQDELRGCCGALEATDPLAVDVARSAFRAAYRDPRFEPVFGSEIDAVTLEVSVLSPLEPIAVSSEAALLDALSPGDDGLVIIHGVRRATFLPKVWETLPEPDRFLAELKAKCGLPRDYWSDSLEFRRYRTTSYAER